MYFLYERKIILRHISRLNVRHHNLSKEEKWKDIFKHRHVA